MPSLRCDTRRLGSIRRELAADLDVSAWLCCGHLCLGRRPLDMDRVGQFDHLVRRDDRLPASFALHAVLRQYRLGDSLCDPEVAGKLVQIGVISRAGPPRSGRSFEAEV